jgi:hypothetical protein
MKNETELEILESIAKSFPKDSKEHKAIVKASTALFELEHSKTFARFEDFVNNKDSPLNGMELIHLKMCGLDIPKAQRTPEVCLLEKEIEILADRINALNKE